MNILFFVQRSYTAQLTRRLAEHYRKLYPGVRFSALSYTHRPDAEYLQSLEIFDEVHSEGEMHLAAAKTKPDPALLNRLEKEYGAPTLWQFVTQNRLLTMTYFGDLFHYGTRYNRDELLAHVQTRFVEIEAFLERTKPDIVVFPEVDVGPSSAFVLERVASKRNIPVIVPKSTRLGSYHTFTDTVFSQLPRVEKRFKHYLTQPDFERTEAESVLELFRRGELPLSYIEYEFGGSSLTRWERVKRTIQVRLNAPYISSGDPLLPSPIHYDLQTIITLWRRFSSRAAGYFQHPDFAEPYIFFPLHIEPELSLNLYAPYYTDQISIIRNVAQSLAVDTCLYVKDHVVAQGRRRPEFYRNLAGIPNVCLIDSGASSLELIRNSQGVVSITGTAALEAALLGKPALTFGDVFFNCLEGPIQHTHDFEKVPEIIKSFKEYKPDEAILVAFVAALLKDSIAVDPLVLGKALMLGPDDLAERSSEFRGYAAALWREVEARVSLTEENADSPLEHLH